MLRTPSSVTILETLGPEPGFFVLQARPDKPGQMLCAGQANFFGGHRNAGESAKAAVVREVGEETTLPAEELDFRLVWEGLYTGVDPHHGEDMRNVALYATRIETTGVETTDDCDTLVIPRTLDGIAAHRAALAPFAAKALIGYLQGDVAAALAA